MTARVLVVEDENIIALDIKNTLTNLGYTVPAVATAGAEAVAKVAECDPDLVLMDIRLRGDMDGVAAAEAIHHRFDVPVVYLSAYADPATVGRARVTEPYGYVLKPFDERELHVVIEMALYRHRMARQLKESERWLAATLRSIGDAVIAVDGDWRIRFMNPVAENLTGWPVENAIGHDLAEVLRVSITTPPRPLPSGERVSGGGVAEGVLSARDGRKVPIEESSTTIRDAQGKVVGSVIAVREISERKRGATKRRRQPESDGQSDAPGHSSPAGGGDALERTVLEMRNGPVQDIAAAVAHLETLLGLVDGGVAETHARQALSTLERALGDMRGYIAALRSFGIDRR
jgi:PAS domain S-box-containing protein